MRKLDLIILCGGLGKRIRSKSKKLPKILIDIDKGKPFIEYLFKSLKIKHFNQIFLSIGYKKKRIIKFVKENPKFNLAYCVENKLLGTGGAVKNVIQKKKISDPFLVVNGDTFLNFNVKKLIKKNTHNNKKQSLILLKRNERGNRYNQFKIEDNKIIMLKKNYKDNNLINCGMYLFYKNDFKLKKKIFSIEKNILPTLIKKKKLNYFINNSKIFFDIGVPKDLDRFKKFIHNKKNNKK
jgi:D-glycero-alpha-D-manno-heptose 1-phosphate guanylyltransferase